jgi:uncharacterized protein YkvS
MNKEVQMKLYDVVRLKDKREGTIVEFFDDGNSAMIEVVDSNGKTIDMPIVKIEELVLI